MPCGSTRRPAARCLGVFSTDEPFEPLTEWLPAAVEEKLGAAPGSLRSKFPTVRVLAWS